MSSTNNIIFFILGAILLSPTGAQDTAGAQDTGAQDTGAQDTDAQDTNVGNTTFLMQPKGEYSSM
jgi:hypothetical protein